MGDTGQSSGETLKSPERVAADTRRLRTVRVGIAVFAMMAACFAVVVAVQFALTRLG